MYTSKGGNSQKISKGSRIFTYIIAVVHQNMYKLFVSQLNELSDHVSELYIYWLFGFMGYFLALLQMFKQPQRSQIGGLFANSSPLKIIPPKRCSLGLFRVRSIDSLLTPSKQFKQPQRIRASSKRICFRKPREIYLEIGVPNDYTRVKTVDQFFFGRQSEVQGFANHWTTFARRMVSVILSANMWMC